MHWLMRLAVWGMMTVIVGALFLLMVISHYSEDLPDYQQLSDYRPPMITRLYAADGRLMAEYAREKRVFVPIGAVPRRLKQAFIAAEDRNFYEHPGIDFIGIARAVVTNLSNIGTGRSLVGGSTITQQVVKNFLLTREQSFERKIKEAILAFRLSRVYSKDKILELYLNQIFLGRRSYGVAAAAMRYFNKSIDELTLEEIAFLAALPKAPSHYDPEKNYERAKARRDWVIGRMEEDGYITSEEAHLAQQTTIITRRRDRTEIADASHYSEEVRRQLDDMYGEVALYSEGLTVHTTLDPELQRIAEKALIDGVMAYERRHGFKGPLTHLASTQDWLQQLRELDSPPLPSGWHVAVVTRLRDSVAFIGLDNGRSGRIRRNDILWARPRIAGMATGAAISSVRDVLKEGDVILVEKLDNVRLEDGTVIADRFGLRHVPDANGAAVIMDPHTGQVLAMSGGLPFRNAQFNRATQGMRQPGSAFKPFVYMAALENGFTPSSIVIDAPIELPQGDDLPPWSPQNYSGDYYGPSTLRTGLEKSLNVLTVRLAQMLGLGRVREIGQRFGIYDTLPPNYSVVLGSAETTLMRMATAYSMIVNGGKQVTPVMIDRIQDREGGFIYKADERDCLGCSHVNDPSQVSESVPVIADQREEVIDPRTAYQMVSMMQGVVQRGTGQRARAIGKPVAGKTGTTNNTIDSWFVGFTPDLVTGVYVGFDAPRTLGEKETGSSVALPIFVDIMTQALADEPATPFRIPPGIRLVKVDRTTGLLPSQYTEPKHIIFEAFLAGTEPRSYSPAPMQSHDGLVPAIPAGEGSTVGTGGLY